MIDHTSVSVSDYEKAKEFYQKALATLGYKLSADLAQYKAAGFEQGGKADFWIGVRDAMAPTHVAFAADSKEAVEQFHTAGVAAGGKDNGAPGYRTDYSPGYYASFVRDMDGNNIEVVWHDPSKK